MQAAAAEDDASGISLGRRAGVRNLDLLASREPFPIGDVVLVCKICHFWCLIVAVGAVW